MNGTDLAILLKSICAEIAQGHYDAVDRLFALAETDGGEGLGDLAESFGLMVVQLEVQIDQKGREAAVAEIVESDFFVSLQARARAMRQREGG